MRIPTEDMPNLPHRRRLTVFVAAFLLAALLPIRHADAQWRATIHAGVTGSTLTGNTDTEFSAVTRLSGGAGLSYLYPSGFVIEPGLNYVVKGTQADGTVSFFPGAEDIPIEATFDLAYLEFPLFFGYVFQRSGSIHPKVFAGPVLAFNLDSTVTYRAKSGGQKQSQSDDTVASRDLGIGAGLGVEWDVGSERLLLGVQSTFGLSNARTAEPELHNRSIGIFTGIVF
jgi:hypothetical protein